ncbi:MAG: gluconokinase [Thermodesulfobacteriota bacterium]
MILIIMGVTGAGKTTVGKLLACKLGWEFYDADSFQPKENIEKMANGISLTDRDRLPWLRSLHDFMKGRNEPAVIACSALKKSYREFLEDGTGDIRFVYLKGSPGLIRERLDARKGHFAGVKILESQIEALEEPEGVLTEDITRAPESIAEDIIGKLKLS